MVVILSYDECQSRVEYKTSREQRAVRFALLREAASRNAVDNQLSEEEGTKLV